MIRLLIRWLVSSLILLFVVSASTFVLSTTAPGDAARTILGQSGTQEQYEALRDRLGLDDPLPVRYWDWLSGVLRGDLGASTFSNQSVGDLIAGRIGVTLSLVTGSLVFCLVVGCALGIASARRRGAVSRITDVVALLGMSVPNFWLGFVLVAAFAVALPIFPATGYVDPRSSPGLWLSSLVLPVVTLGIGGVAVVAKQTRDSLRRELAKEYTVAMRAQGLSERTIVYKHALKNAAIPVTTVLGLIFVGLFSGTVLIENVFALPGLGGLLVRAATQHDLAVIEGVALVFAVFIVLANLFIDLAYGWLNPKARVQ